MAKAENETSSPFGRGWLISGAVVLLALAVLAFMAMRGATGDDDSGASSGASSPSASDAQAGTASTAAASDSERCTPPEAEDKDFPTQAPEVQWERHPSGGVVPVSETHGPVRRGDQFWHCTSHTPTGALMAGMSLVYDFSTGDKDAAAPGGNREQLFKDSQYGPNTEFGTVEGYRVLLANDSQAEVEYLVSAKGAYGAVRVPMVWNEDRQDWLLDSNSADMGVTIVDDTSAFTRWR